MPPDSPEVAALRQALAAQVETIALLKVAVYGLCGVVAATNGFFIAWIRTLYDARAADDKARREKDDELLERVLQAVADVQLIAKAKTGG